ncbi:glycosyltransferase family 4 protein [Nonomuraea typhae]|uniref:glycosyltransferase family 4 protein n=1 Tax=Nonomuraea typhae TaxID=2603600 RepID=UPI001FEBA39E|nr:glycosyltransferase family 4 protein [Nonomuraea typhae]
MTILTGVDLPLGSRGGSVELLRDLYLDPAAPLKADAFMLTGGGRAQPDGPILLDVAGKQLAGEGFWAYVKDLARAIERRFPQDRYDLLHLQHLAFGATPALLRAFPGHPRLALVHGTDLIFAADHPTQLQVLRDSARAADAIVVPTAAMADHLRRLVNVEAGRIVHIPWGVPDRLLTSPPPRGDRADGEALRLLYAGRLAAEKAPLPLLRTLADMDGVVLSVAAPAAEYAALAARADLSRVRYLGWLPRPSLWENFAGHDLLIVPSTRLEAFGLVAVEAQACGLPVLYRPVPGLVEVLGESAIAVEASGSVRAAAAAVARLRRDPGELRHYRGAGLANAARFPLSGTARRLHRLSRELIG